MSVAAHSPDYDKQVAPTEIVCAPARPSLRTRFFGAVLRHIDGFLALQYEQLSRPVNGLTMQEELSRSLQKAGVKELTLEEAREKARAAWKANGVL